MFISFSGSIRSWICSSTMSWSWILDATSKFCQLASEFPRFVGEMLSVYTSISVIFLLRRFSMQQTLQQTYNFIPSWVANLDIVLSRRPSSFRVNSSDKSNNYDTEVIYLVSVMREISWLLNSLLTSIAILYYHYYCMHCLNYHVHGKRCGQALQPLIWKRLKRQIK